MKTRTIALSTQAVNLQPTTHSRKHDGGAERYLFGRLRAVCATSVCGPSLLVLLSAAVSASIPATVSAQDQAPALAAHVEVRSASAIPRQAMQESLAGQTLPMWPYVTDFCFSIPQLGGGEFPVCEGPYQSHIMGAAPAQ